MNEYVVKSKSHLKVYISVVHKLKELIQQEHLSSGDRLPSERELSERLGVGRSSVREAFRALELLGLIETRQGEGTFLRDFRDHHLVELLGMFILQHGQAEKDVLEMKEWIEFASINRLFSSEKHTIEILFDTILTDYFSGEITSLADFKAKLIQSSGNRLSYKVWLVLHDFDAAGKKDSLPINENDILSVKQALITNDSRKIQSFCSTTEHFDEIK